MLETLGQFGWKVQSIFLGTISHMPAFPGRGKAFPSLTGTMTSRIPTPKEICDPTRGTWCMRPARKRTQCVRAHSPQEAREESKMTSVPSVHRSARERTSVSLERTWCPLTLDQPRSASPGAVRSPTLPTPRLPLRTTSRSRPPGPRLRSPQP